MIENRRIIEKFEKIKIFFKIKIIVITKLDVLKDEKEISFKESCFTPSC